jgi:toxin-antitoxin system PIN domain toxin
VLIWTIQQAWRRSWVVILLDVNVLVYAHREDATDHERYHGYVTRLIEAPGPFGVSELVLSGFLRVVTHPKVFSRPSPLNQAIEFTEVIRAQPNCVIQAPGERHWDLFVQLCTQVGVKGNLVPDAYHAALAIETGSTWITTDRGFGRFPGLRWHHPLD